MKSWLMMNKMVQFQLLQKLVQESCVWDSCPLRRIVVDSSLLFVRVARRACKPTLRVGLQTSILLLARSRFVFCKRIVGLKPIHYKKWRNFDKISLKAFNQIEQKKWKHCQILFGETSEKDMFCKHVNKSAFLFSEEIQIYLRLIFCLGNLFPQNDRKRLIKAFLTQN